MRKRLFLFFAVLGIMLTSGLKAQNMLSHWGADNAGLNAAGVANTEMWRWGWNSNFASYQWATANSSSVTIRYCDTPTFHGLLLKGDDVFTGRFAQLRWDGTGNEGAYFTLGMADGTAASRGVPKPLPLKKDKSYNLSFWANSLEVVRVKMQVTTDPTGADESKAISTLDINVKSATNSMTSWNHDVLCPATGDYYLVFKFVSGKVSLIYLTDIDFHQVTEPTAKASTSVTKDAFTANWTSVSNASGYVLDVATDAAFTSFVAGNSNLSVSGLTQEVSGLSEGTTYYYRVRAINDGVESVNSTAVSTTTVAPTAPAVPVANSAINILPTSFTATWDAVPGAVSYKLDVATDAGFTQIVRQYGDYTVLGTSYNVIKLRPNTTYYYRVRAFNGTMSSSSNSSTVKTQKLLMVVMAGQSNMSGRGTYGQLSPADTVTYSNVFSLNRDLDWVRARHPLHWERSTENGVSVGISFAKKLADMIGGDVAIGLVPCAAGGTTIEQWLSDYYYVRTDSFNLYTNLMTRVNKAKESGDIIGLIWHQGEGDAVSLGDADSYLTKTQTFFTKLRKDVHIPNMPIVAGEIGHFTSYTYRDVINESMFKLKDFLPYYDVTKSDGLAANSDNVHFSATALVEFGKRYADIFYPAYEAYSNNNDPFLSSLGFNVNGKLNPEFDADINNYTYYLPQGTTSVTPTVTYIGTGVSGVETVDLTSGSGVSNFKVTSSDGSTKTYTVNYKINEEKDYTYLIVNNDFDYAPTADCAGFVNVASGINGWSSNAWRPTASGCGEFYGWKFDAAYSSLGGNSQGINANTGGTKNGDWAAWVAGTGVFTKEKLEFSQTIDKDALPAGTYKVQCLFGVQHSKITTQRLFANNNVQYHGSAVQYVSNLTPGEINTFAGYPSNENLLKEMAVYVTIAEDEPLKLGIRTGNKKSDGTIATAANPMWGWFKMDYFRLTRIDPVEAVDANLAKITLSTGTLNFSPDVTTYTVELPKDAQTVSLSVIPSTPLVTIKGTEDVDVSSGVGKSTIVVTALDGKTTKTYTINYDKNPVSDIQHASAKVSYWVKNGQLTVSGANAFVIYNISGLKVANVKTSGSDATVQLSTGVYIVKANDAETFKVIIK